MMSMRFLFSRARRGLVGAGLLLLVALAVACGGGGGGGGNGGGDNGGGSGNGNGNGGGNNGNNGGGGNGGNGNNGGGNGGGGGSGGGNLDAFSNLPTSSVIVPAAAGDGNAVLTITVAGATMQPLARSGFMSDGGATATISLTSNATVIFDSDNKVAPLVLSAVNSDGAATATIRFVSAPRVITADLLPIPVAALDATVGATILAAGAAEISIWHNGAMAVERYEISPDDDGFGVDSATGLVTATTDLTPDSTYNLTLHLVDSTLALTASRSLRVTVSVLPPPPMFMNLPASPVVAAAAAEVGDAAVVITVANAILPSFERSGFGSDGGEMATISLTSDPASIFTFDNAVVSLTITLSDSRRTIAATLRFMSAPRVITADLLPMPVAALEAVAGATILAAGAAEISIWHNGITATESYEISPNDGNFGVDSATGLVTATTDLTPTVTYDLTLHLIDRALTLTASRSLLVTVGAVPPFFVDLLASPITVAADAGVGEGVLTVTTANAALPPFSDRSGFMSDGGATATIALASEATAVFDSDNAVASLALTLKNGGETAMATIQFVSALRVIDADLLRIPVAALDAVASATILAAGAAKISIWHNGAGAVEEYEISPDDGNFGVNSATGLVTAATDLTPGAPYDLNLSLTDNAGNSASRSLRVTVGALPLLEFAANLPASSVVVAAAADIGDSVLTITAAGAALPSFARSGFRSDGGETATIALASIPADIFTLDYAVASLAFTLSDRRQTVAATVRFVSAPRAITADLLRIPVAAFEALAGVTILAAGAAKISIWHNDETAIEEYDISPNDGNFGVDSATGLVTATTDLTPGKTYDLTLHLIDRGLALTASRSLRAVVGALLPLGFSADLPVSPVVVAADADIGDSVLTITAAGAALPSFARSGFRSDGGAMAAIALTSIPADIFTLDYAVASLSFTLSDPRRTIAATVRFVSAPRAIAADLLSTSFAALEAVTGATILAAGAAKISIWHNDATVVEEYEISPNDGNFGVDSATGLVTAMTDLTPDTTYDLTLHLVDSTLALTASRSLRVTVGVLPLLEFADLPASSVVVAAAADIGDSILTITVAGAALPSFARSGFMSDGGATATIALASIPADIFTLDYAVASLAFTLSDRRQTVAATIRFVSAPRAIDDDLLSITVAALEAVAGATILAADAAEISIWHNDARAVEEYEISPNDGNFGVDSATGLVTATTDLTPGETYNLTLHLIDRGLALTATRSLEAVVGALPLLDFVRLPASSVVVAADADIGDSVLTITVAGAALPSFARSGFRSDGGATATISLASIPADIFTLDYAVASLSFTLSDRRQTVAATVRFVSAPRAIAADLLLAPVAAFEAVAGVTILAAGAAKISIWHNDAAAVEEYKISPDDGNFGVDAATGLVTATTDLTPDETYDLTLHLIDRRLALTASRSLRVTVGALLPLGFAANLPASSVVVAADADIGDAVLTITVAGAALPPFVRSGFRSDGGAMAAISLASIPADIFTLDYAVASLAFTLSDPRRTIAATVRFVSAPRAIAADLLSIPVAALEALAGVTILAAGAAEISIWHNDAAAVEEYKISLDDGDFGVDSATGLVTAATDLTPDATYDLTLHLIDRGLALTASRSLEAVVGVLPLLEFADLPASSVVVAAAADIGDSILTITVAGAALPSFARSGFMSDGGATATIALASIPADIFTLDYAVASLAFTLSDRRQTVAATIRFVSAPRAIDDDLLSITVAALEAVAGATILAADAAEISIWHNGTMAVERYEISPDDGNFGVDLTTGLVTATTDLTPDETYNLTLHLIDRALSLTASRSLLVTVGALPPLEFMGLPASSVVVAAAADIGDSVLTITVAGATLPSFARSGFRSDGGATATISLASIPADIFTLDYAVASLSFTLSDRRQTVAATVRFVSAPRAIAADLLLAPVAAFEAVAGVTILAAGAAKISIWHNDETAIEEYDISPNDGNFGVDSATGLVTATTDLTPDETYDLTLHLIDRRLALTASRSLRVTVGALLPLGFAANLPASSVVVAADADIGDAVLTITVAGAALPPFVRSGFRSDGGAMAAISLASIPADIFTLDYAVASLAFTLSDPRRTIAATVRFVSAPRAIAADLLSIPVAALEALAGVTILAAGAAEISIWHNDAAAVEEYKISPDDGNFGVDSATGLVTATTDLTPGKTYNLTLHLIDRGLALTASRSLEAVVGVLPTLDFVDLPASSVVVAAAADIGDAILTITVAGATLPSFARLGFMSDGGETATIALASIPAEVFTLDYAVASLAFTLSDRRQTVAATIRFVSAPRVIAADLLSISVAALEALAGVTILAAGAADISIWHNDAAAVEEYDISPDDGNFGVDSATGLVTATTDLTPGKTYNLTLHLIDRGLALTASRSLEAVVGALPLLDFVRLPASSVVVAADADIGDAILTITVAGATLPSFARSGFRSDGGATATISLASIPADIFTLDYAVASLSFTLSDRRQTVAATIRFVSAPRAIAADLLSAPVAALEALAGVTILAAGAAEISIWHNDETAIEEYDISPDDGNFGVDSATGLVTATTDLTPGKTYNLILHLIDRGLALTASRSLEAVVGVLPTLDFVDLPASSVVVAVAADIGDAVLTITVAGATLPSFARSGFRSDGGALATISLASEATVVFDSDNAVASLAFTLSDRRRTVAATIRFVSAPRVIAAAPATISVSFTDAVAGVTILAAGAAKISIWHNGAAAIEEYKISPDDGNFGVDLATGLVTAAMDLTAGDSYDFTLRLIDDALSLTASRSLRVVASNLNPLQLRYLSTVEWSRANAYDYLVEQDGEMIDLRVVGGVMADGATRETAFPIYNIWQLQAIDGLRETSSGSFSDSTLFGANAGERLGRHYRLMNDIDAGVTEEWAGGLGFHPIGNSANRGLEGGLYGDGYAIRDLWINRPNTNRVGLFAVVDGGVIASVGIEDSRIVGFTHVGALVGQQIEGVIQNAWASGAVTGNDFWVGGLAGLNRGGAVVDSWTRSDVRGGRLVGGLVGAVYPLTISGITIFPVIERGQAMGDVRGDREVGGLVGLSEDGMISENRSLATVTGENTNIGGLIGYSSGGDIVLNWSSGPVWGSIAVGGLVGFSEDGMISENRSLATVTGEEYIGGLIGYSSGGDIVLNWSSGLVRGSIAVGGLVGFSEDGMISENRSLATVTGENFNIGGLIGYSSGGDIVLNWSSGPVRGRLNVGGLVGRNVGGMISENRSLAAVTGEERIGGLIGTSFGGDVVLNGSSGPVRGGINVGGLVGRHWSATIARNWSIAAVTGKENVGGLIGNIVSDGAVALNWSAGSARGDFGVGGLIGRNRHAEVGNNWSVASASGEQFVGGLLGRVDNDNDITDHVRDNWSGGAVAAQKNGGGMLGYARAPAIPVPYWSEETSGTTLSWGRNVRGIPSMQESTAPLFESDPWDNGDSDLSDNVADFPVLATLDIGLQWAGLAYGLTRVLAAADGAEMAEWGERREMSRGAATIRIDTNAMAPDTRAEGGRTSTPDCVLVGGVLWATTNYNSAIVLARAEGGVLSSANGCEAVLTPNAGVRRATLHLAFAAAGRLCGGRTRCVILTPAIWMRGRIFWRMWNGAMPTREETMTMTGFRTLTITARAGIRLICVLTRTVRFTIFGRYTMCGSCRRSMEKRRTTRAERTCSGLRRRFVWAVGIV